MNTKIIRDISIITSLFFSLLLVSNHSWAQESLFSLSYGQEDSQIGVYIPNYKTGGEDDEGPVGPSCFFVDAQGNFYITDVMSQVIKKFSPTGDFILKTETIDSPLHSFCVDNEGNIYIIHGASCDRLTQFDKNGKLIWSKTLAEFGVPVNYDGLANVRMINDFLYLETGLANEIKFIKVDKEGVFLEEVPSDDVDNNGNFYTAGYAIYSFGNLFRDDGKDTGEYVSGAEFDFVNPNGSIIKNYKISFPGEYKNSDQLRGIQEWDFDSEGNIYATVYIFRVPEQQLIFDNGLFIDQDNFIFKFNQKGELVSTERFPASPFIDQEELVHIDTTGNLYYLQFHADKMDVVKVPPTLPFQQFTLTTTGAYFIYGTYRESFASNIAYNFTTNTALGSLKCNFITASGRAAVQTTSVTSAGVPEQGTVAFSGACTVNSAAGYSYTATFKDIATPGAGKDIVSITITGPNNYKLEFLNKTIAAGDIAISTQ